MNQNIQSNKSCILKDPFLYLDSFLTVGERLSAETLASQGLSFENLKKVVPQNNFFK